MVNIHERLKRARHEIGCNELVFEIEKYNKCEVHGKHHPTHRIRKSDICTCYMNKQKKQ